MAERNVERYQSLKIPNSIGWIHRELDDLAGATEQDRAGLEIARKHQVLEAEVNSVINLGHDYSSQGEAEKTDRALADAEALLQQDDWTRWRFNIRLQSARCEHLLSRGAWAEAEVCARQLLDTTTHYEARKYVAKAHDFLARAAVARGDFAAAKAEWNSALELLQRYPAPLAVWKIHSALGGLRLRAGSFSSARESFDEAAKIIRAIALNVNDPRLRSTFLDSLAVREVLRHSPLQFDN